jgi:tetrahydromethanopterin S-methyltransferase subunit G
MEAMRKSWTDERLDDLSLRVDTRFSEVDARFDRLEGKLDFGFEVVDKHLKQVDARFDKLEGRFDRLQHTLVQASLTMLGSVLIALFFGH